MSSAEKPQIDFVIGRLANLHELGRPIPSGLVAKAGQLLDLSPRTVWRRIERERKRREGVLEEPGSRAYELTERDIGLYFELTTNVAAVHRRLEDEGANPPSERTLLRAFERQLTASERGFAKTGINGRRANSVYIRREAPYRAHTWQVDFWEVPVWVIPERGHKWKKAWLVYYLDAYSRAVVGHVLHLTHTAEIVLAALKRAVLPDETLGPFCGIPNNIVSDNGGEFLADAVTTWQSLLGSYGIPLPDHSPHLNGKVERMHRTLQQQWANELPFFIDGPRQRNGLLYGPKTEAIGIRALAASIDAYFEHYNMRRPHSALGGQTPAQRWEADPTPLRTVRPEDLRGMPLPTRTYKVLTHGIHFENQWFIAPELNRLYGRKVEVQYIPYDYRSIDVYFEDRYVATAVPNDGSMSAELRTAVVRQRREDNRRADEIMKGRSRRAQARFGLEERRGEGEQAPYESDDDGQTKARKRVHAKTDMLGLGQRNQPIRPPEDGGAP